jgi:hypothetical protein
MSFPDLWIVSMTTVDKFVVEEMYIYMYATICSNNGGIVLECLHIHLILPVALIKLFIHKWMKYMYLAKDWCFIIILVSMVLL